MISKSFEKYFNSLKLKKYREERQRFIAEGEKVVSEFIQEGWQLEKIVPTSAWIENHPDIAAKYRDIVTEVEPHEMKRLSSLVSPSTVMAVIEIPKREVDAERMSSQLHLALDGIQDPGNMGTIIRIADWFGIENVFCSQNCVDVFNPKTIQASMGSIARVKVLETNLEELFFRFQSLTVYGAFTTGENLYETMASKNGFIVIGNEAHGISSSLEKLIHHRITIPRIGKAESLNAAVAAGIICAWMKK